MLNNRKIFISALAIAFVTVPSYGESVGAESDYFANPNPHEANATLNEPLLKSLDASDLSTPALTREEFPALLEDTEIKNFALSLKDAQQSTPTPELNQIKSLLDQTQKIAQDASANPNKREENTKALISLLYSGEGAEKRPEVFKWFLNAPGDENANLGFRFTGKDGSTSIPATVAEAKSKLRLALIKTAGLINGRSGSKALTAWEVNRMSESLRGIKIKPITNAQGKKYEPQAVELDFKHFARNAYKGDKPLRTYAMSMIMKSYADAAGIINAMGRETVTIRTRRGNRRARSVSLLSGSSGERVAEKLLGAQINASSALFCAQSWKIMVVQAAKATGSYNLLTLNSNVNSYAAQQVSKISKQRLSGKAVLKELDENYIEPNAFWTNVKYKSGGLGHAAGILVTPDPTDPSGKRMQLTELQFNSTRANTMDPKLASRSGGVLSRGSSTGNRLKNPEPFGSLAGCVGSECPLSTRN